jgi:histidyl-tRNA synthetase
MTRTVKKTAAATGAKQNGIQGIKDIITQTNPLWQALLKRFQKLGRTYGFQRIETPLLEEVSLYQNYYGKDAGELPVLSLDVAGKPMAIRPSLMPSVLRSYVQHKIGEERPLSKWAYSGNVLYYDHIGKVMSDYEFGLGLLVTVS